jgi:hypothetical protein
LGNLVRGSIYRKLREIRDGVLWKWSISFCGTFVRGTWRGLLYCGHRKIRSVRFWKWESVYIGATLLGNMEGRSFLRDFERRERITYLEE